MANGMPLSHPMHSGEDPYSYARNSSYQKGAIEGTLAKTRKAILEKLDLQSSSLDRYTFTIVDYGCSVGPNTFFIVEKIVEAVKLKFRQEDRAKEEGEQVEFHVFFNDLENNDFNTLFRTLPASRDRDYFVAGVPGSFRGRLFPRKSIHIGHTSTTLHWLSEVPEELFDRNSPAWDKRRIRCNEAFEGQFKKDMARFLEARAEEIVPGGLMIISVVCLPDGVEFARTWKGVFIDMRRECLIDMANSGSISMEKVESFVIPTHTPHISTLKGVIEQNGCFNIEMMEEVKHPMEDKPLSNDFLVSLTRAVNQDRIEEYFGEGASDELFDRLAKKLDEKPIDFKAYEKDILCLIVLKRVV